MVLLTKLAIKHQMAVLKHARSLSLLPSLRIGEAVIVGEAISIPSRVKLPLQSPRPDSSDPEVVKAWNREIDFSAQYATVVTNICEQKFRR